LASLLTLPILAILGCATATEYVEVRPTCEPALLAPLPQVPWAEIPEEVRAPLLERERRIVDWALENEAIVEAVCQSAPI